MPSSAALSPSATTDLKLLETVGAWQQGLIAIVTLFAAIALCGMVCPPLAHILPASFISMHFGDASLVLLCGISLFLTQPHRSPRAVLLSRILGALAAIGATLILIDSFAVLPIEFLTGMVHFSSPGDRISPESASAYLLVGVILSGLRSRGKLSHPIDAATLSLSLLVLTYLARYVVGIHHLRSFATGYPFSLEAFVALCILTVVITTRRAEYGVFAILFDSGIGGKTSRFASPAALVLPFLFALAKEIPVRLNLVLESSVAAISTALLSIISLCLVLAFARHTNKLETANRELSLRDELTRLYNRRGFYALGEQGIRLAQRAHQPFFVLFIDVDNLKVINDSMGHEIGSALLQEMADLLTSTFRELDIISRLGGDEFVVAGNAAVTDISAAMTRLEAAAWQANAARMRPYHLSYSIGLAMSSARCTESLDTLLERADKIMYDAKRARKQLGHPLPVLTTA